MKIKFMFMSTLILSIVIMVIPNVVRAQVSSTGLEFKGFIEAKPAGGNIGIWIIDDQNFIATDTTEFRTDKGPLSVGVCAEVEYNIIDNQNVADKIASKNHDDCAPTATVTTTSTATGTGTVSPTTTGTGTVSPTATTTPTATGTASLEQKGLIEAFPENTLIGNWIINGQEYVANVQTTFEQERGSFALGRCVEVEYNVNGAERHASKIKTKRHHNCNAIDDDDNSNTDDNELYGLIEQIPNSGLNGIWTVGGLQFSINDETDLENGPFTGGLLVEVHFTVRSDGTLIATKIEGKQAISEDDQHLAVAYGQIEVMPGSGLIGEWHIGGSIYEASTSTKSEQDEGIFAIGACAKVRFQVTGNMNIAVKIETESNDNCPNVADAQINKTVGFVSQLPSDSFVGSWLIAGNIYQVMLSTEFEEEHGALVSGAFVKVKYVVEAGERVALAIETHVPPNAGSINAVGTLSTGMVARQTVTQAPEIWQINGQSYTISDTTLLDDDFANLVDGQWVQVNAYTLGETIYATKVMAATKTFMPFVKK